MKNTEKPDKREITFMKKRVFITVVLIGFCVSTSTVLAQKKKELVHYDEFSNLDNWVVEQMDGGKTSIKNERFEIDDLNGCTAWFKEKLEAPYVITFKAKVIGKDGLNDRVSDLNCFWLANDMDYPDDFFHNSEKRGGKFGNYHNLRLYYVGLGGHNNTKTRFRRYDGTGARPILPEHDLSDKKYLIKANKINNIKIVVNGQSVKYFFNGILVYDVMDPDPYKDGYFGIRTFKNHMWIDDFKIYSIRQN